MRITKNALKDIILESLDELNAGPAATTVGGPDKMKTGQQAAVSQQQKKSMVKGGITDQERAAINTLTQKLAAVATKGNLLGGNLKKKLEILVGEIEKVLQQPQSTTQKGVQE